MKLGARLRQILRRRPGVRRPGVRRPGVRRPKNGGFNLVILAMMLTVMNIMVAKALPLWSTQIQRQKEADLIFRGLQYAEAVRVFKLRYNRAPVRLQELVEADRRCIRQLWNNPLSPEAAGQPPAAIGWEPIFEGQPDLPDQEPGRSATGLPLSEGEEVERIGPILGVRSKVEHTAIKLFFDSDEVREWRFTPEVLEPRALVGGGATPMPLNAALIGRPWPPGINPPIAARPAPNRPGRQPGQRPGQPVQPGGLQRGQPVQPGGLQRGQPGGLQPGGLQPGGTRPGFRPPGTLRPPGSNPRTFGQRGDG